jgi:hypothetical protein
MYNVCLKHGHNWRCTYCFCLFIMVILNICIVSAIELARNCGSSVYHREFKWCWSETEKNFNQANTLKWLPVNQHPVIGIMDTRWTHNATVIGPCQFHCRNYADIKNNHYEQTLTCTCLLRFWQLVSWTRDEHTMQQWLDTYLLFKSNTYNVNYGHVLGIHYTYYKSYWLYPWWLVLSKR